MCTLHLFFRVFKKYPVVLAANRDERLSRDWDPPSVISESPLIFGPRDRLMGGTWTGVNSFGLLSAIANREGTLGGGSSLCSRGNMVLSALSHQSAGEAVRFSVNYSPACKAYTLLLADPKEAFVLGNEGGAEVTWTLRPGLHVITNRRFRDPEDAKAQRSLERMEILSKDEEPDFEGLGRFLADHGGGRGELALCVHSPAGEENFGTTSSSIIAIDGEGRVSRYLFAGGPPCTSHFREMGDIF